MIYDILLRGRDRLPRRFVILENQSLAELVEYPHLPECHVLSSIAECVRTEKQQPIYSRDPVTLLTQCLDHDLVTEDAWSALCDDIECSLVTADHVALALNCVPHRITGFYNALIASPTITHATAVVRVLAFVLPLVDQDVVTCLAHVLQHDVTMSFLQKCVRLIRILPLSNCLREKAFQVFGKTLLFDATVATSVCRHLETALLKDTLACDYITLLLACPIDMKMCFADRAPFILETLVHYIPTIPAPRKGPFLELVATLVDSGDVSAQHNWGPILEPALRDTVLAPSALRVLKALEPPTTLMGCVLRWI